MTLSTECLTCSKTSRCAQTNVKEIISGFACPLFEAVDVAVAHARIMMFEMYGPVPAARALLERAEPDEETFTMLLDTPAPGTTYSQRKQQFEMAAFQDVRNLGVFRYKDQNGVALLDAQESLYVEKRPAQIERVLQFELLNNLIVPDAAVPTTQSAPTGVAPMSQPFQPPMVPPPPGAQPQQMPMPGQAPQMVMPQAPFQMPPQAPPGMPMQQMAPPQQQPMPQMPQAPQMAPPPMMAPPPPATAQQAAQVGQEQQQAAPPATGGKKKRNSAGSAAAPPPPPPPAPPQQQMAMPQQGVPQPQMQAPQGWPQQQPQMGMPAPMPFQMPAGAPAPQMAPAAPPMQQPAPQGVALDLSPVLAQIDQVGKAVNAVGAAESEGLKQLTGLLAEIRMLLFVQVAATHHIYMGQQHLAPTLQGKDVGDVQKFVAYMQQFIPR